MLWRNLFTLDLDSCAILMGAIVRWVDGLSFVGRAGTNHWVQMDASPEVGGFGAASTPMELVLLGLGGCTAMDVVSILRKKRVQLDDFWVELEAERAEDHPKIFTKIRMKYVAVGKGISREAVEKAVKASEEKYCSVGAIVRKTTEISYDIEIRESQ